MSGEEFVIALMALTFGSAIIFYILWVVGRAINNRQKQNQAATSSLTTSDLETLMRRAVADAQEPLLDRIEALEAEVRRLPEAEPLLTLDDPETDKSIGSVTTRQRARG